MGKTESAKSAALFERAKRVLPGGVSRNTLLRGAHPLYAASARGCRVTDVDGVERIDFANNMASHIHGHAFEPIVEAVCAQLRHGSAFTLATQAEVSFAEHLCARSPGFDRIRFVNSGTEAVMAGIKAARAFTGRSKIVKVEGSYHGAYDFAEVSQESSPQNWGDAAHPEAVPLAAGTPRGVVAEMVILPFNDAQRAIAILDAQAGDIAAVLVDPIPHRVGLVPVGQGFVDAVAGWCRENGALLFFDEVITYRSEYGGMQERFKVKPDLTAMGKMIGGGFPVGALAGRSAVMDVFVKGEQGLRLPHSGTFSANPVTMTAGLVAMEHFDAEAVARLNRLGDYARTGLEGVIRRSGVPACVTGTGSLLRLHLRVQPPENYRDAYPGSAGRRALNAFIEALYDEGVIMIHTGAAALSTVMGKGEIDRLFEAVYNSLLVVRPWIDDMNS